MKWISFSFYSSYYYFIIFWVITQIGGDLLAGFLVIYTYLTTDSLTINEPENNMNNKDNDFAFYY